VGNRLTGRALFFEDITRILAFLQVAGPALGGFLIVLGSVMPWYGWQDLAGPSGLTVDRGKITFGLGLLMLIVAAGRGFDRSSLQRWLTVTVGCAAGVTVATLARFQMIEVTDNSVLLGFFPPQDVAHGLRLTFAGGIVAAAMSLLNVIPVPVAGPAYQEVTSIDRAEGGQS
jgi:hypothetical protein